MKKTKNSYVQLLSKRIDNLPYSIKPKHFDEFKKNLLKRLVSKETPGDPPFLEIMYQCFKEELMVRNIHVPQEQMLDHSIMFISLMKGPYLTNDDFEYEMNGKNLTDEYYEVFETPIKISQEIYG